MRWTLMTVMVCAHLITGCGGETESQVDATADGHASDAVNDLLEVDASSPDAGLTTDAMDEKQWPIVYNIVDGGGDSPSCYNDANIVQACCNGEPCRGFCVLDDDGSITCSCYGIPGGCIGENNINHIPNVCCSTVRGCESESYCNVSK